MNKKTPKERGKVRLSRVFQELKQGDRVFIDVNLSYKINAPSTITGRTGIVQGKRGKAYIVKMKEYNEDKTLIINPIHLKKLN